MRGLATLGWAPSWIACSTTGWTALLETWLRSTAANFAEANGLCRGFIGGFAQYHAAMPQPGTRHRPLFCVPNPAPTGAQAAAAFATWSQANPQYANDLAVDGLARWFITTYPCPQAPARRGAR